MTNLVLCGGMGERLWPISRSHYPKQFNRFLRGCSLLQQTVTRNRPLCGSLLLVTGVAQQHLARQQLREAGIDASFLLEPFGRGTGPAVTLACLGLPPEELVLMTPSDHYIGAEEVYRQAVGYAAIKAAKGRMMLLGIRPAWAETGYGYIQAEGGRVIAFREKPDAQTAAHYVESGLHYWNSGIMVFRAGDLLSEMAKWRPDVLAACRAALADPAPDSWPPGHDGTVRSDPGGLPADLSLLPADMPDESPAACCSIRPEAMADIPAVSVDHAVLEKSDRLGMVACEIRWSDMGSFESLHAALDADASGNVVIGPEQGGDCFLQIGSSGNLVYSESKRVAAIDVSDLMIVDTKDVVLVGKLSSAQKVRELVGLLTAEHSPLKDSHETEVCQWGSVTTLRDEGGYRIRLVRVNSGCGFSTCHQGAEGEQWMVLDGTASVNRVHPQPEPAAGTAAGCGGNGEVVWAGEPRLIGARQSVVLPPGLCCRVRNDAPGPLVMLAWGHVLADGAEHGSAGDMARETANGPARETAREAGHDTAREAGHDTARDPSCGASHETAPDPAQETARGTVHKTA